MVEPLISNTAGWGVNVLPDKTIDICGGSYCSNHWTYKWNGHEFEESRDGELVRHFTSVGWDQDMRSRWEKDLGSNSLKARPQMVRVRFNWY